ncbi:MAG: hypothetical protein U0559_15885 [Anaerolineae bacterium]
MLTSDILFQILIFGLANGAVLALNAISVTMVYGTVRTLNLAHGDTFALTTVVITTLVRALDLQPDSPPLVLIGGLGLVLIVAMGFAALLNVAIERLAFKPFRNRSRLAPLIATLGLSFILFQGALVWRTLQPSWVPHEHRSVPGLNEVPTDGIPPLLANTDVLHALGLSANFTLPFNALFSVVAAIACAIIVTLILQRSKIGRAIRASSQAPDLAQMTGVNLDSTIRRAFAIGGALTGVAAFIFALYYARPFGDAGAQSGLMAFAAALLGGIGSPIGALISALLLGMVGAFSDYALSAQWTPVLLLALLIGLLVLRPTGLASRDSDGDSQSTTVRDAVILTTSNRTRSNWWLIGLLVILAVFPIVSSLLGLGWQILLRGVGIFVLLALGLNILLGVAGVLDLGFALSFGLGGYVAAIMTNRFGLVGSALPQPIDFTIVIVISVAIAALFGAFKGGLARRLHADYLAVATLALGLLGQKAIINLRSLTGGVGGIGALPAPIMLGLPIDQSTPQYYLVVVVVIVVTIAGQRLIRSRLGRAWLAASDDEVAAESSGVDAARHKSLALIVSSALAGLAGALYAGTFSFVSPDMAAFHISVMTLTMVILGGAGNMPGAILGAMVIIGYDQLIISQIAALLAQLKPPDAVSYIGSVPDVRGTSFFNFGLALYLTVLVRVKRGGRKDEG